MNTVISIMKALSSRFKYTFLCTAGFASLIALCSFVIHPSGSPKSNSQAASARYLHVSPEAGLLLKRACMDCHSNRTLWPWYSYVAPTSWLVERDVSKGREHLNFSEWDQYTFKQRQELLAHIATAVKNREMPLPQYLLIHRDARLSDADTDVLYGWARAERRRIKAMLPFVPTSAHELEDSHQLRPCSHSSK